MTILLLFGNRYMYIYFMLIILLLFRKGYMYIYFMELVNSGENKCAFHEKKKHRPQYG
jgi:hypothetical protein